MACHCYSAWLICMLLLSSDNSPVLCDLHIKIIMKLVIIRCRMSNITKDCLEYNQIVTFSSVFASKT